jgi:hypothetical protein
LALWDEVGLRVRVKYFLVQSLGSSLFLAGVVLRERAMLELPKIFFLRRLRLKLAAAPLHG